MLSTYTFQNKSFNKVFWLYHVLWWSFLICVDILRHLDNIFTKTSIEIILLYGAGSLVGLILHVFFRKLNYKATSLFWLFGIIIAASIIASYIWNAVLLSVDWILGSLRIEAYDLAGSLRLFDYSFFNSVLLITYSGLYFTLKIWVDWVDQKIQVEKANRLRQQSQLQMLRYQINPHFIFNSLCSLRALVANEKAELMITKLSQFLRYTLDEKRRHEVPLREEIEVTKSYLDIEKVRFGNQLIVNYNIDDSSKGRLVPSFLLNSLVENAIKHGFKTSKTPVIVDIHTNVREDKTLVVEITNTGRLEEAPGKESGDGAKMGLNNMKQRLEVLYPGAYRFDLFEEAGEVHARISLFNKRRQIDGKTL